MTTDDDPEASELRQQDRWQRRRLARLAAHPDCRDPDHPGCEYCEPRDDQLNDDDQPTT